jgi:hypothetical protein
MGAGDAIFEKFGHNTIRIVDRSTGQDIVHHWGMFDFSEKRFFINFALGYLNYSMASEHYADTVAWYRHLNRSMWLQELNLTASQKVKLRDFCRWNQREENRYYAYNYFTDNCSTRVRDAIDHALGGQIKPQLDEPSGTTWRWHTRRLTRDSVVWYTMLNTAMGPATDRPISQWEEGFLPVKLSEHLESVTANGGPLVKSEELVFQSTRPPEANAPPSWVVQYFLAGAAVGGMIAWLAHASTRGRRGRIGFVTLATLYAAVIGFVGWLGLWAWFFTAHWGAWRNENMFEHSPLAVPLVVLIPMLLRDRARPGVRRAVVWVGFAVAASTLLGLALSPMLPQVVAEPMALALPMNLALAWGVWRFVSSGFATPQGATQAAKQAAKQAVGQKQ